jgi:hypothetical protein
MSELTVEHAYYIRAKTVLKVAHQLSCCKFSITFKVDTLLKINSNMPVVVADTTAVFLQPPNCSISMALNKIIAACQLLTNKKQFFPITSR